MFNRKRRLSNKIAIFLQGYFIFGIKPCCAWYYANSSTNDLIAISKLKHKYNIKIDYIPCPNCLSSLLKVTPSIELHTLRFGMTGRTDRGIDC